MSTQTKWSPSPEQRAILDSLQAEVAKSPTASDFARDFLDFGPSKLSKILAAVNPDAPRSYFDDIKPDSIDAELASLAAFLEDIPLKRARAERLSSAGLYDLSQFRAVRVAVQECMAKTNPERLVKYLAPTGGGKSQLCAWLANDKSIRARVVEVREAWRRSYYTVLTDIIRSVGMRINKTTRPGYLEDELVKFLSSQKLVLALDEAEYFGASAINGLKLLLNKTRVTIVMAAIPEAHDRWNHYFKMEADQLDRRTHAIVELSLITPADAAKFFPKDAFKEPEEALNYICTEASQFGHYSLVRRIATRLSNVSKNGIVDVKKATDSSKKEMRRPAKDDR